MGLGWRWRGAGGTPSIRTGGSTFLWVTVLLHCGTWRANTQMVEDTKSVYFWETGTGLLLYYERLRERLVVVLYCLTLMAIRIKNLRY